MNLGDAIGFDSPLVTIVFLGVTLVAVWLLRGSRLLSLTPRMHAGPDWLIAKSARRARFLSLFSMERTVTVDRAAKLVSINRRTWWIIRRMTRISFAEVTRIVYSVSDWSTETMFGQGGDSLDSYSVQLQQLDGTMVNLFRFIGEGSIQEGWDTPWWLPDGIWNLNRLFDSHGSQAIESREFVNRLQQLLEVPVGRPPA